MFDRGSELGLALILVEATRAIGKRPVVGEASGTGGLGERGPLDICRVEFVPKGLVDLHFVASTARMARFFAARLP